MLPNSCYGDNAVTQDPSLTNQAAVIASGEVAASDDVFPLGQGHSSKALVPKRVPSETIHIAWLEVLETGVAELDAWHRLLINECNRLLGLIDQGAPWLWIVAAAALLAAKLMDHFRFEEEMMERNGFPRRDTHAAEHRRIESLLTDLIVCIKEVDGSQEEHLMLPAAFKSILIDVMVRHDLDYRSHLLHQLGR